MEKQRELPSEFWPGDFGVKLCIPRQAELLHGEVTKVTFSENKVYYDLQFNWLDDKRHYMRIHNVESTFVKDMNWEPSMTDPKGNGIESEYVIDGRYQKNSRGRWELKPEFLE